jgi:hypothetical protein
MRLLVLGNTMAEALLKDLKAFDSAIAFHVELWPVV